MQRSSLRLVPSECVSLRFLGFLSLPSRVSNLSWSSYVVGLAIGAIDDDGRAGLNAKTSYHKSHQSALVRARWTIQIAFGQEFLVRKPNVTVEMVT